MSIMLLLLARLIKYKDESATTASFNNFEGMDDDGDNRGSDDDGDNRGSDDDGGNAKKRRKTDNNEASSSKSVKIVGRRDYSRLMLRKEKKSKNIKEKNYSS
jgi:hypothetical protein